MIFSTTNLLIGAVIAVSVALLAYRLRSLSVDGAIAAAIMGTLIFGLGGVPWAALMLVFFVSSSALSRLFRPQKADLRAKFEKNDLRDWAQVLANGGLGIFLIIAQQLYPDAAWPWLAYAGSLATVNGDTWATEIGVLSKRPPRLLTTLRPVERGASGAVTGLGTLATLAGALLVALFAAGFSGWAAFGSVLLAVTLGGFVGGFMDSLLGATLQAIYLDPIAQQTTEHVLQDGAGRPLPPVRGLAGVNNDVVNFLAALVGAVTAVVLAGLFA